MVHPCFGESSNPPVQAIAIVCMMCGCCVSGTQQRVYMSVNVYVCVHTVYVWMCA